MGRFWPACCLVGPCLEALGAGLGSGTEAGWAAGEEHASSGPSLAGVAGRVLWGSCLLVAGEVVCC